MGDFTFDSDLPPDKRPPPPATPAAPGLPVGTAAEGAAALAGAGGLAAWGTNKYMNRGLNTALPADRALVDSFNKLGIDPHTVGSITSDRGHILQESLAANSGGGGSLTAAHSDAFDTLKKKLDDIGTGNGVAKIGLGMDGGTFSPTKFIADFDALTPQKKKALYKANPELEGQLSSLRTIAQRYSVFENQKATAPSPSKVNISDYINDALTHRLLPDIAGGGIGSTIGFGVGTMLGHPHTGTLAGAGTGIALKEWRNSRIAARNSPSGIAKYATDTGIIKKILGSVKP